MEQNKTIKNSSKSIAYSGNVTVKVVDKKGKQIGKTKKFKNSGRWPLFQFFTTCLAGDFNNAEPLRPKYIDLFHADESGGAVPQITDGTDSPKMSAYANEDNRRTLVTYAFNSTPKPETTKTGVSNNQLGSSKITYSFLIPFSHIDNKDDINMVCMYNKENITAFNYSEPSAFFFITEEDGENKKLGSLLEGSSKNNYNLIIEWVLTIKNEGAGE